MLSMMFGMGKKPVPSKKAVQVTVDGKVLTSTEPSINLRKFLIANGVDVYPLKAKITGNCGGAGKFCCSSQTNLYHYLCHDDGYLM